MKTTEQHTHRATHIHPTVGRVVLFHLGDPHHGPYPGWGVTPDGSNTYAATVAYVHNAHMVNLTASDANGIQMGFTSVPLVQGEDERPAGHWCEWMPYQKGQVAKTEQTGADILQGIGMRLNDALTKDPNAFTRDQIKTIFGLRDDHEITPEERAAHARRTETAADAPGTGPFDTPSDWKHPAHTATQQLDNDGNPLTSPI